jgi:O-antigen/teichoic acid export membrane protein
VGRRRASLRSQGAISSERAGLDEPGSGHVRPPLVSSVFQTFVTQVASSVLALVNVFIISRYLGPTGRGEVVFLVTISLTLSRVASLSVEEATVNLAAAEPRLRPALATNSIVLAGLFGALAAGLAAALSTVVPVFGSDLPKGLVVLSLVSLPLLVLSGYLWRFVQADYRFALANIAWFLTFATNAAVNGALALAGALTVGTAFVTWLGGQGLGLGLLIWCVSRQLGGFGLPNLHLARQTVGFGFKAYIGQIMSLGNFRLDQWILGILGGTRELGLYSVAVSLNATLVQLPSALDLAQRPDLARATRENAARRASVAFRLATTTTVFAAIAIAVLAPYLCVGLFGDAFRGSVDDLRVLLLGTVGVVAAKVLGSALTAQRFPLYVTGAVGAGFVVTLALDILLIPRFGGLGAAAATASAYMTVGAIIVFIFLRTLGARGADLVPRPQDVFVALEQLRRLVAMRARASSA